MVKCVSCKKETSDFVKVKCPDCKKDINRCSKCRSLSVNYKCECGFEGP